jgi:hypothetical protein
VKYTKNSVINRTKIRTRDGWLYLTIPVGKKFYNSRISDVKLPADKRWRSDHWKTIIQNYAKADFFSLYKDFFEGLYLNANDFEYLVQINTEIISYLFECFEINVEVIIGSELGLDPELQKTDLLVAALKSTGADIYLSGPSGRKYLDPAEFVKNNIDLRFFQFQHPVYEQRFPGFEPNMAAIDLLFNVGPQARKIVKESGNVED